jgi:hypothetical protein
MQLRYTVRWELLDGDQDTLVYTNLHDAIQALSDKAKDLDNQLAWIQIDFE